MDKKMEMANDKLIRFWDQALTLSEDDKAQERNNDREDIKQLAPSEKLYLAVAKLGTCKKVLDYGCGNGWASIVAASQGCEDVVAVDLGENIIDALNFYASLYGQSKRIHGERITPQWLKYVPSNTYDGIVCSNVLDVIPYEICKDIAKELARIATDNATIIIGLNFYMSEEMAKAKGVELDEGKYLFVNGVLRLASYNDEQWCALLNRHFIIESLDHFAWPGESKESRRLFVLRKRLG